MQPHCILCTLLALALLAATPALAAPAQGDAGTPFTSMVTDWWAGVTHVFAQLRPDRLGSDAQATPSDPSDNDVLDDDAALRPDRLGLRPDRLGGHALAR